MWSSAYMQGIFALLFSATSAFTIDFSDDPGCAGEDLGTWAGSKDGACVTQSAGIAAGFSVNATDGSENGNLVVFYSSDDCSPVNEIAASNVDICTGADYASFQVMGVTDCCLDSGAFEPDSVEEQAPPPPAATVSGNVIPLTAADPAIPTDGSTGKKRGLRVRNDSPSAAASGNNVIHHGVVRSYGNTKFKIQQVAQGVFHGVDLEDWDPTVHSKNDAKLGLPADTRRDLGRAAISSALSPLEDRQFNFGMCRPTVQCAYNIATKVVVGVESLINTLITNAIRINNNRVNIWAFLNKPLVVQVITAPPLAYFVGWITAVTTLAKTPVSPCSRSSNDADVFRGAVQGAMAGYAGADVSDLTVGITLSDGSVVKINITVRPTNNQIPEVCGAPVGGS